MVTITISFKDLQNLVGKDLPKNAEELTELLSCVKGEVEALNGDELTIALQDSNRPELWCPEGISRELRGALGVERGAPNYSAEDSALKVFVNTKLKNIRPFIACVVVKGVKLSDVIIKQLMQMQDKIDTTYGRNRRKTSIGLYNFDLLKFPLKYTLTDQHENPFIPLGFTEKMAPHEIIKHHPKGQEYGNILKGLDEYPIFLDADGRVLSMPPIINSADLGKVDEKTKNVLVEVTGTDFDSVNHVLTIIATTLAERGGKLYSVTIDYPARKPDFTPHLEIERTEISGEFVSSTLGLNTVPEDIVKLLQKARYSATADKNSISVAIPCYRKDIMHPVDIIEDIAIAYGYNNFDPLEVALPTAGKLSDAELRARKIREICAGLGAQEVLNFVFTNKDNLFRKMNSREENVIEVENPVSFTYSVLRNKLIPSLMEFFSQNTTKEFHQVIFEVGEVAYPDSRRDETSTTERRLAFGISHARANFTEAKQNLESIYRTLGKSIELREADHDSFIVGRCAKVYVDKEDVGIIGELHPSVLQKWGLEMPVVAFEVRI
jgi:phenylalanyl-tRNA synthetase beta chain